NWMYVYDDENRLVQWFHYTNGINNAAVGDVRTDFVYDGLSRLRMRSEYTNKSGVVALPAAGAIWVLASQTDYIYDGNRVIQERNGTNNTPTVSYTRGNDLSGSLEGAGGIGGLLARSSGYSGGNWSTH